MTISIDGERCTGHGRCYELAPELVEPDDDGRGVVVLAEVRAHLEEQARRAEGGCPERAVTIQVTGDEARAAQERRG